MLRESGDWKLMRQRFGLRDHDELDLHFGRRDPHEPYWNVMADVETLVREGIEHAYRHKRPYLLITHGWSTSRNGATTARSIVRGFINSKEATPFIERAKCIQHNSAFLVKIRDTAAHDARAA